ncbi:MAG: hypothetical protein FWG99_09345 [Treponema sp.]|nr:hypothetical protein [Treponema sp.]
MNQYVIGIDTGATKSHLALFDKNGTLIDLCSWGPLNYEVLPGLFAQFEEEIGQFVSNALSKNKIKMEQISYSVFGIAGVDTRKQHNIISEILKRTGFKRFTLVNDAFLGIPAGSPDGTGICANNGTGCTLVGINKDGREFQIGGAGYVTADYGGGGMMGEAVVSAVYSELFRRGEPTCMTSLLFNRLDITNKYDFVEKIHEKTADGSFNPGACAKMLFEAVREKDGVASEIFRKIAESYAGGISCMIDELKFAPNEDLFIVLMGSIFVKGEHSLLIDTLKEIVQKENPAYSFEYRLLDVPAVAGAVIWALRKLDNKSGHFEKINAQLRAG